jgi:hypothetical protein
MTDDDFPFPSISSDELVECAYCLGAFLPEDMDGEHCRECAAELFND